MKEKSREPRGVCETVSYRFICRTRCVHRGLDATAYLGSRTAYYMNLSIGNVIRKMTRYESWILKNKYIL